MALKSTTPFETTPSETEGPVSAYRLIYIDEPIFGRADTNDDGDFNDSEEQFYYTSNNLYCVTALLDTSGDIIELYEYTPYGELKVYTGDGGDADWWDGDETPGSLTGNYYTFTGRRSDPEAGLMYFRNRYYSTELGRFITRDPEDYILGDNVYVYVSLEIDPLGLLEGLDPGSRKALEVLQQMFEKMKEEVEKAEEEAQELLGLAAKETSCLALAGTNIGLEVIIDTNILYKATVIVPLELIAAHGGRFLAPPAIVAFKVWMGSYGHHVELNESLVADYLRALSYLDPKPSETLQENIDGLVGVQEQVCEKMRDMCCSWVTMRLAGCHKFGM